MNGVEITGSDGILEVETDTISTEDVLAEGERESAELDAFQPIEELDSGGDKVIEEEEELDNFEEEEEVKEEPKEEKVEATDTVYVNDIFDKETANTTYKEAQSELKLVQAELELLETESKAPDKPEDDLDDDAIRRYEIRLALWEDRNSKVLADGNRLTEKSRRIAQRAESAFRKDFKGIDLNPFENWVRDKRQVLSFISGDVSLYELYTLYSAQKGKLVTMEKVKKNKTGKVKVKPISVKATAGRSNSGNGLPSKYKHANQPMFKKYVAELKKKGTDLMGNKYTNESINDLCKQEYTVMKEGHAL